jgi:hypothetical protein
MPSEGLRVHCPSLRLLSEMTDEATLDAHFTSDVLSGSATE